MEEPLGHRHNIGLDARGNLQAPGQTSRAVSVPMRDNQSGLRLPHRWVLVIMLQVSVAGHKGMLQLLGCQMAAQAAALCCLTSGCWYKHLHSSLPKLQAVLLLDAWFKHVT